MSHFATPPTVSEIAERLSVVQRWNGDTIIPWSVLQHSLLVASLLPPKAADTHTRLFALLHDAAEMLTSDIPRYAKTPEQRAFEKGILKEILNGLGLDIPPMTIPVRRMDAIAALAEAEVLVSPIKRASVWENDSPVDHEAWDVLVADGANTVWQMRDMTRREAMDVWISSIKALYETLAIEDCVFLSEEMDNWEVEHADAN